MALLLIAGIVVYLMKPDWMLEGGTSLKVTTEEIDYCEGYGLIEPENGSWFLLQKGNGLLDVITYEQDVLIKRKEVADLQLVSNVYQQPPNSWFITRNSEYMYWLVFAQFDKDREKTGFDGKAFSMRNFYEEYKRNYTEFADGMRIVINKTRQEQPFFVKECADSIVISCSFDFFSDWQHEQIEEYESSIIYQSVADSLSNCLQREFTSREVLEILTNDRRAYRIKHIEKSGDSDQLFRGRVWGMADYRGNGNDNYLIEIRGTRFVPSQLYCHCHEDRTNIFEFEVYNNITAVMPWDFEDDGKIETIIALSAPCSEVNPGWFDYEPRFSVHKSYLLVLDDRGRIKKFNGKDAVVETGGSFSSNRICLLADGRIITATNSQQDNSARNLKLIDLPAGTCDTLGVEFIEALSLQEKNSEIVFFHKADNKLHKSVFDKDFNQLTANSVEINSRYSLPADHTFEFKGESYHLLAPLKILDKEMNIVYEDWNINPANISYYKDTVYFTSKPGEYPNTWIKMKLAENKKLNLYYVTVWLFLIMFFFMQALTSRLLSIPQEVVEGSYAVLYEVAGVFYNWRIFGKTSVYTQPVSVRLSDKRFHETMRDISDEYQKILERNLGLVKLYVYKLSIGNELHIMQRIAHDIKNHVHLVNMKLIEQNQGDEELTEAMRQIYEKTSMLSDFSRLNLMQTEKLDLVELIDTSILRFSGHIRFKDINWELPETEILVEADENLLQVAVLNLIENSLDYSPAGSEINVKLFPEKNAVRLIITNTVDDKNSKKGSGIGLKATEKIIKAHGGEFIIQINDQAEVEIKLYQKEDRGE
jgi:two-component sensor histidine kinase